MAAYLIENPSGTWSHSDAPTEEHEAALDAVNAYQKSKGKEPYELIPSYGLDDEGRYVIDD